MQKYTSIESFQHLVRTVRTMNARDSRYIKPISFMGTVKLHGSNAGVRVSQEDTVAPQSRIRVLSLDSDNYGWAAFVESRKAIFVEIARSFCSEGFDVTVYGEWIGPGIQKSVAINQLPEKQFVIFGAVVHDGSEDPGYCHEEGILASKDYSEHHIHFIGEVPTYELSAVDFLDEASLQTALDRAEELTKQVEAKCPWAAKFGIEGLGEGIVWKPVGDYAGDSALYFKTKGEKHKVVKDPRAKPSIDPLVSSSIAAFVEFAVTENRLEQGIGALKEAKISIEPRSTGEYIKWVNKDVLKECSVELSDSQLDWKQVARGVTAKAREFWQKKMREL